MIKNNIPLCEKTKCIRWKGVFGSREIVKRETGLRVCEKREIYEKYDRFEVLYGIKEKKKNKERRI